MNKKLLFLTPLFWCLSTLADTFVVEMTTTPADDNYHVNIAYTLTPHDALIKNSLRFSFDNPALTITEWKSSQPATTIHDTHQSTHLLGYTGSGTLTLTVAKTTPSWPEEATLFMHYQLKNSENPQQFNKAIKFQNSDAQVTEPAATAPNKISPEKETPRKPGLFQKIITKTTNKLIALKNLISNLVEKTTSMPLQLFFVYLLGILMSLTPCIYPMIPITIGILQTTAGSSFLRNFLLACSYSFGVAMTFAIIGMLAATGSAQFGALLINPYFVGFIVLFFGYLAFSMLGFYDMYTPRFMQGGDQQAVNGSFTAAFFFGAMSGTVASPCVSPGLFLLLGIVTTLGSVLLGFLYLFIFGLGLSTPLLIIGTFSNSLNMAPRAGLWMVEVKKLFGFMLLGMCFFYLNNIMPWYILLWLMGGTLFVGGLWYIVTIRQYDSRGMRWYKQIVGTVLLVTACLTFYQALKTTLMAQEEIVKIKRSYAEARAQAVAEHKLLLVDFGAQWCLLCKEIEHKFFNNQWIEEQLHDAIIVQVDCTNPEAESCKALIEQFKAVFPTMLLVEPQEQKVLARWGGELLDLTPEAFVDLVNKHQK